MDILTQLVINGIIAGAIYTLIALGFNLIYGATKFFNKLTKYSVELLPSYIS